jgi:hypothetical protein
LEELDEDNGDADDNSSSSTANDSLVKLSMKTGWSDIEYVRDARNITMVDYKNLFGMNIGKAYNPNFVDYPDWFLNNYDDHGGYYLIPYNYDWQFYSQVSAPWYDCEAQSKAIFVMAKEYNATGDVKYLDFSEKVLNALILLL